MTGPKMHDLGFALIVFAVAAFSLWQNAEILGLWAR